MVVLVDFAILVINGGFLKAISVTVLGELYMLYSNFEIPTSNGLRKTRDETKV